MNIIFDDENLRVVYLRGISNYLLIAFSPMNYVIRDENDFYAKSIAKNNNLSMVSIIAKKNHWYAQSIVMSALNIIKSNIIKNYDNIILYGVSMGGYAAIKYSRCLEATNIIAMMPQFTINPNEINDSRYFREYFLNEKLLDNMSIKLSDISGKLYIFYDKYFQEDLLQARKIEELYKSDVVSIHTPFTGHTLGHILIGSIFFERLLYFVNKEYTDIVNLKRLIHNKVKIHPMKYQGVIRNAIQKHPQMILNIFKKLPQQHNFFENRLFEEESRKLLRLMDNLKDILNTLVKFKYIDYTHIIKLIINRNLTGNFILTHHNNYLCYDVLEENLVLRSYNEIINDFFILPLKFDLNAGLLGFFLSNIEFIPLTSKGNKQFVLEMNYSLNNYKMQPFLFYRKISKFYIISDGVFHATATPKGTIDFGQTHIKDWEKFYLNFIDEDNKNKD